MAHIHALICTDVCILMKVQNSCSVVQFSSCLSAFWIQIKQEKGCIVLIHLIVCLVNLHVSVSKCALKVSCSLSIPSSAGPGIEHFLQRQNHYFSHIQSCINLLVK